MKFTKSQALCLYLELKDTKKFLKQIIKRGFEKIGCGAYKSVYSKKKLGYVIKITDSLNDEFAKVPNKLKDFYVEPYFIDNRIVIQQKANTKNQELNYNKILHKLGYHACENLDVNPQNCGSIKDKPVVFDFAEI